MIPSIPIFLFIFARNRASPFRLMEFRYARGECLIIIISTPMQCRWKQCVRWCSIRWGSRCNPVRFLNPGSTVVHKHEMDGGQGAGHNNISLLRSNSTSAEGKIGNRACKRNGFWNEEPGKTPSLPRERRILLCQELGCSLALAGHVIGSIQACASLGR